VHAASPLDRIVVVLVDTKSPANIGAIARCMMNMGARNLMLVNPPKDPEGEARKLAAGADEVLDHAIIAPSLREAVSGANLVIGASRHSGRQRAAASMPRELALRTLPLLAQNTVALVFGNEVNGLDKSQLALCNEIVSIPSHPDFASLNLSHAVLVVLYEFFIAALVAGTSVGPGKPEFELPDSRSTQNFYDHLHETLIRIEFVQPSQAERMMSVLRKLCDRARPDTRELSILRGVLTAVNDALSRTDF
jgi:tRNA (cytidine32/uridine32-2'-O)-methyltransferase